MNIRITSDCDKCMHKDICKYAESYKSFYDSIVDLVRQKPEDDAPTTLNVTCQKYQIQYGTYRKVGDQ